MCDPATMAVAALNGVQSMAAISEQNAAAAENRTQAIRAANDNYASETERYIEENRSLLQGSFDAILQGRAAESEAYTAAIQNGVQGTSVRALLRDRAAKTERSVVRSKQESVSLRGQVKSSLKAINQQAEGRISQVQPTRFGVGDLAGILAPIVKSEL